MAARSTIRHGLWLAAVLGAVAWAAGAETERSLLPAAWIRDGVFAPPAPTSPEQFLPSQLTGPASAGNDLAVELPEGPAYSFEVKGSWREWLRLEVELALPADYPRGGEVWVFTKDWDLLWRQVRCAVPADGGGEPLRLAIPITGPEAALAWDTAGHERPWHTLTAEQIVELGLKFSPPKGWSGAYKGTVQVRRLALVGQARVASSLAVRDFALSPCELKVGEAVEASFELADFLGSPFDRQDVAVEAEILTPGGTTERVKGFYAEDFLFRPAGERGELVPFGRPRFKVRYMPRSAGRHAMTVTVRNREARAVTGSAPFEVAADPGFKGVVRVDPRDRRYLSFANGELFAGLGINARSPYDTRHEAMAPQTRWRDRGLNFYREAFPRYRAAGVNVAEVWMSSWWLALEWVADAPGNHGVGHMNPYRAWQLDELMRLAEANGVYILLVLNNHGKFSTFCDQEWARNPYNAANGGFLNDNEAYFTDPRARAAFKRTADYIVARWGHSPNLLAWKLFSEINLTGRSSAFYQTPAMIEWHREMAAYLHEHDPYGHLVTTHWSSNFYVINPPIAALDGIDLLTTDAYGGNTAQIADFIEGTARCPARYSKPAVITEFGGSPMGDSLGNLRKQLHLANWQGVFSQMAIPPMFWWFAIVEEQELYGEYKAVRAFMDGEDARGGQSVERAVREDGLAITVLHGRGRTLVWGYDREYFLADAETVPPRELAGVEIAVNGLRPGRYRVEHWNCASGTVVGRGEVSADSVGPTRIGLPTFRGDFALKITPL